LHRFTDPEESAATLQLRDGRTEALDFYFARDRVTSGSSEAMLEDSYEAWANDTRQGLTSLLIASTGRDATALNARKPGSNDSTTATSPPTPSSCATGTRPVSVTASSPAPTTDT
jgi:hypothetical protein